MWAGYFLADARDWSKQRLDGHPPGTDQVTILCWRRVTARGGGSAVDWYRGPLWCMANCTPLLLKAVKCERSIRRQAMASSAWPILFVECPTRGSWYSVAPPIVECYDTIALCCWQMYFQVFQPDLKADEKLAWMIPFLQVHAGTHRVWLPCRPLVRTVLLIWGFLFMGVWVLRVLLWLWDWIRALP